jgi:hypothetical protein
MADANVRDRLKKLAVILEVGVRSSHDDGYRFALNMLYSHFPEIRDEVKRDLERHVIVGAAHPAE